MIGLCTQLLLHYDESGQYFQDESFFVLKIKEENYMNLLHLKQKSYFLVSGLNWHGPLGR